MSLEKTRRFGGEANDPYRALALIANVLDAHAAHRLTGDPFETLAKSYRVGCSRRAERRREPGIEWRVRDDFRRGEAPRADDAHDRDDQGVTRASPQRREVTLGAGDRVGEIDRWRFMEFEHEITDDGSKRGELV